MRIARFTTGDDPRFGAVGQDENGETVIAALEGDPLYRSIQLTGEKLPLSEVRLLAPVIPRSKVVGVGHNYAVDAVRVNEQQQANPLLFLKPNTAVVGPDDPIVLPQTSNDVEHEAELAVVIGRIAKSVPPERVTEVIFGYTCANDVTARDLQHQDSQWARAKGFDSFCPLGPWIETDLDPSALTVRCRVNDEERQLGSTSQMIVNVTDLVSYVSSVFTLLPGDVIMTGTPPGSGPLTSGDQVTVSVEGIGVLSNPIVNEEA